jgi:hypothetical protein
MLTRVAFWTMCLGLLAAAAWHWRDAPAVRELRQGRLPAAVGEAGAAAMGAGASASAVRKCIVDGQVLYTNDECPQGARGRPLQGGTVSVVPAAPAAPRADGAASSGIPNARDLLIKRDGVDLQEKRMERLEESIGK